MKGWKILAILAGAQAALIAAYLGWEALRPEPGPPFAVESIEVQAPPLVVVRGEQRVELPDRAHLVHFWATWCTPCQRELPSLLAASEATGVPLLAVTDEPWPVVSRYFDGDVPEAIVLDPARGAAEAWEVSGLPDTFVVQDGRIVGRMGGPRDWSTDRARSFLETLGEKP